MKRSKFLSIVLLAIICFNLFGCVPKVKAENLMDGISANAVSERVIDEQFKRAQSSFALNLFKNCILQDFNKNTLISPLSIMIALAMATNGASGQTKAQMQTLLGGEIPIERLNEYLYSLVKNMPNGEKYRVQIANSIWLRDEKEFTVKQSFLQTNANYYGAQVYKTAFDKQTVKDINNWVNLYTDGMIEKIIESISKDTIAYLVNALLFEAEWPSYYERNQVRDGIFTTQSGEEQKVKMMNSTESGYIENSFATGLIKYYRDSKYSFMALLPNEGLSVGELVASLTEEELYSILCKNCVYPNTVYATIPKFEYQYEINLNKILSQMGMTVAFDPHHADFSALGNYVTQSGEKQNIFINEVVHKTSISVAEKGTKAGAVTKIGFDKATSPDPSEIKYVTLDRPFIYMIVENATGAPLFIGSVESIK